MKSDIQLQQDVRAELKWDPAVHAAQVGVEVRDGVVTLAGEVGSYAEKLAAEAATQRVSGVRALAVSLKVKLGLLGVRRDADIALAAGNVLGWNSSTPPAAIKAKVENGWITLSGDVFWQYQRLQATDSVGRLPGVTGVSNQIAIKPPVAAAIVRADVERALQRRSGTRAPSIDVVVRGDEVTLAGTVHNWPEREAAAHAAWSTPGVRQVNDQLSVLR